MSITVRSGNSDERAAPSDAVPGPSGYKRGVTAGWVSAKQHRKGGLAPTAPPVSGPLVLGDGGRLAWVDCLHMSRGGPPSGCPNGLLTRAVLVWYMVRTKERARRVFNCYPSFSGDDSEPDSSGREQIRGEMVKKGSGSVGTISSFRFKRLPEN
ncbi:hypothetical protein AgCh_025664 [Apium graveolens]